MRRRCVSCLTGLVVIGRAIVTFKASAPVIVRKNETTKIQGFMGKHTNDVKLIRSSALTAGGESA
jgi:hypothetical protein